MKDNKNIVGPFLREICVPEWAISEIFGDPDEGLPEEDRKALDSFRARWTIMSCEPDSHFCTSGQFYAGRVALGGTCLTCRCLPNFFVNAKLYQGDLVQRMGKTRIVCIYNGLQIGGNAYQLSDSRMTLLETLKLFNDLTLQHSNAEGYLIFKREDLIFASNKKFESLIPQIREKFPHIFNL